MLKQRDVAQHLDLSVPAVRNMVAEGHIPPLASTTLDEIRIAYIRRLREMAAGRGGQGALDLTEERARLAAAQADKHELELRVRRGELVEVGELETSLVRLASIVMERLRAVPVGVASSAHSAPTIAACEAIIRGAIDRALEELAAVADRADAGTEPAGGVGDRDSAPSPPPAA